MSDDVQIPRRWDEATLHGTPTIDVESPEAQRQKREGEPFAAATDCPWCGVLAVHWLSPPRFEPDRNNQEPAARALRMINDSIAAVSVLTYTGGPPHRRWDTAGTIVARVCVKCDYRWGQT